MSSPREFGLAFSACGQNGMSEHPLVSLAFLAVVVMLAMAVRESLKKVDS
jgi:hypothetical protein